MRRAIPVIVTTAGGLALVAGFHTNAGVPLAAGAGLTTTTTSAHVDPTTISTAAPRATAPPSTAAPTARTLDGPVIETEYGPIQVRVVLSGTRIVDVQALELPKDRSRSVRISEYAGPQLRSEALQAQSANINLISGASYTSQAYADSLQGALDKAGR